MGEPADRRARILALLAGGDRPDSATARLCQVCSEVAEMTGAGIILAADGAVQGSICASDGPSDVLQQLEYTLGEGPSLDAHHQGRPVLEPHLAEPAEPRWPAFTGSALAAGVAAVFSFPLHVGTARLGAMSLYRDRPGHLHDEQYADCLAMADVAAQAVLVLQAGAPAGSLPAELESGADFHYNVHQAAGMVAAQLDVSVVQALVRLRAHAFGNERTLDDVADDVIARRLRFDPRDHFPES